MAKKATAEPTTALATVSEEQAALAAVLGDMDFDVDGLDSVDREDVKITALIFNMKGKDESGRLRKLDEYFNTTTEEAMSKVRVAFVDFAKFNTWKKFDQTKNKSELICSSYDQVTGRLRVDHPNDGRLAAGAERACATCPDAQWRRDEKTGKNTKDCSMVYSVYGALLDENLAPVDAFMIRFSRTSAPAFKTHLNKHHIGKSPTKRGGNVPLFAYEVELTLDVDDGGNYAVPVLAKGRVLPRETIAFLHEQAKKFREFGQEYAKASEKAEDVHGGGDFVETKGESLGQNDFADA
jgi:hypothetical protein